MCSGTYCHMALKLQREAHCIVRACGQLQDQVSQDLLRSAEVEEDAPTGWMANRTLTPLARNIRTISASAYWALATAMP
jgi:hypothetical protein